MLEVTLMKMMVILLKSYYDKQVTIKISGKYTKTASYRQIFFP